VLTTVGPCRIEIAATANGVALRTLNLAATR
jgi:hypothetical protein